MRQFVLLLAAVVLTGTLSQAQSPPEKNVPCVEGQTAQLAYGDHTSGCEIDYDIDIDFFSFYGEANDQVRIRVYTIQFDPILEIRDPSNNTLEVGCSFSQASGLIHRVCNLPETGTYTLRVFDSQLDEFGVGYLIQIDKELPVPSWATGLPYDAPRVESIDPLVDMDVFAFKGRASTEIRIIVFQKSLNWNPQIVKLWYPVVGSFDDGSWSCGGDNCHFTVDHTLPQSGTYFLVLADDDWRRAGDYQISIQCLFGLCPTGYYIDSVVFSGRDSLEWDPTSDPTSTYHVVRGDLGSLLTTKGDFSVSTTDCVATGNTLPHADALDDPDPGQGFFYLVRALHDEIGLGSYDSASSGQISRRGGRDSGDVGINSSPNSCPAPITGSFAPANPNPGPNVVNMTENATLGDLATISVNVTDTSDVYAASFSITYDPAIATYESFAPGTLLEQAGNTPNYLVSSPMPGTLVVGASRTGGVPGTNAVGTVPLILLTFRVTQIGTSPVGFVAPDLLDDQAPPQPIPGITWYGGDLVAVPAE